MKQHWLPVAAALVIAIQGCSSDPITSPGRPNSNAASLTQAVASPESVAVRAQRESWRLSHPELTRTQGGSVAPFARTVVRVVAASPWGVAVRDDGLVAVTGVYNALVSFLDVRTKATVGTVGVSAAPTGIAYSPDGKVLYVASQGNALDIVDPTARRLLLSVTGFAGPPLSVITSVDGRNVFIGTAGAGIYVMDATTKVFKTILPLPNEINAMAVDSSGAHLYATDMSGARVIEVALATMTVGRTWMLGGRTQGIACSRDGLRLIVLNEQANDSEIDLSTGVATAIPNSIAAFGIADAPTLSRAFWTQPGSGNVQGFLTSSSTIWGTLNVGAADNRRAAFHRQTRTLIVTDNFGSVAFIN